MEDKLKSWLKALKLNESTISMLLGGLVVVVVGILIYNYFSSVSKEPQLMVSPTPGEGIEIVEENGKKVPAGLPTTHVVAKSEDLWKISEKYFGNGYNWVDIAKENKIANPNLIEVDQKLTIPKAEVKVAPVKSQIIESSSYTVVAGDSLWKIAVRAYQDGYQWTKVADANKEKLANPDRLEKGMVLSLPR